MGTGGLHGKEAEFFKIAGWRKWCLEKRVSEEFQGVLHRKSTDEVWRKSGIKRKQERDDSGENQEENIQIWWEKSKKRAFKFEGRKKDV